MAAAEAAEAQEWLYCIKVNTRLALEAAAADAADERLRPAIGEHLYLYHEVATTLKVVDRCTGERCRKKHAGHACPRVQ